MSGSMEKAVDGEADRANNGRFLPGHKLAGPGNAGARINVAALAKRKAKELDIDLDELLWDVILAMLLKAACGDTKAAKVVFDMLGEQAPKGPIIAIDASGHVPQAPPLFTAGADGAPTLGEHLKRLVAIAEERNLVGLLDARPADVVAKIANRSAEEELLS